jgi:hypothetical protein
MTPKLMQIDEHIFTLSFNFKIYFIKAFLLIYAFDILLDYIYLPSNK